LPSGYQRPYPRRRRVPPDLLRRRPNTSRDALPAGPRLSGEGPAAGPVQAPDDQPR
jgi:hypothetical protein